MKISASRFLIHLVLIRGVLLYMSSTPSAGKHERIKPRLKRSNFVCQCWTQEQTSFNASRKFVQQLLMANIVQHEMLNTLTLLNQSMLYSDVGTFSRGFRGTWFWFSSHWLRKWRKSQAVENPEEYKNKLLSTCIATHSCCARNKVDQFQLLSLT